MKPLRWTRHALDDLAARDISQAEADRTLTMPDRVTEGKQPRVIYQRRFRDRLLAQEMLLRIVVEETELEHVIITVYKTSKFAKYE